MSYPPPPPPPPEGPYGAAPPPPVPGAARPGELLDRFLARLVDFVLLAIVLSIVDGILLVGALGLRGGGLFTSGGLGMGASFAYGAVSAVLSTAAYLGYFGFLESTRGATLGKQVMKLRVQSESGGPPTLEQALKRNIWLALPLLGVVPFLGGLLAGLGQLVAVILIAVGINSDTVRRQPWTDKLAGTLVLKEG